MRKHLILPVLCLASIIYGGLALFSPKAAQAAAAACCAWPDDPSACGSDPNWYCCLYNNNPCYGDDYPGWCFMNNCPPNPN